MDKYSVKIMPKAARDIDEIYTYLVKEKEVPEIALNLVDVLEDTILSLENLPYRGSERKTGAFVNKGYRQIFAKNFTIVYCIDEKRHFVIIITVRYSPSKF